MAATTSAAGVAILAWFGVLWSGSTELFLPVAVAVAVLLGFASGPVAVTAPNPIRFAAVVAVKAVLVGEAGFILLGVAQSLLSDTSKPSAVELLVSIALIVPFGFILMLPVTFPVAVLTTVVLRRIAASSPVRGVATVVAVIAVSAAVAVAAPSAQRPSGLDPTRPVSLTWTVENRSDRDLELGIWSGDATEYGGSIQGIGGCFITTGASNEPANWFITLGEPIDDEFGEPAVPPSPTIDAARVPGRAPAVWLVVERDGSIGAFAKPQPADSALVVNLCKEEPA